MEDDPLQEPENEKVGREVIIIIAVFFEAGLAPISLFLGWLIGYPPLLRFSWSLRDAGLGILAAVPLILMFVAMLRWPIGPLSHVKKFCEYEVLPLLANSSWSEIGLISLSAGVGEEMLFRGVLQASFTQWLGLYLGVGLASVCFGVLHPISITYVVIISILGLYLGALFYGVDNLLAVMLTHAVYDFAALAYLIRIRPALNARGGS
jgi:uncharacterized protein